MKCYCDKIPVELKSMFSTLMHVLLRKEERRELVEGGNDGGREGGK